jgi:hypothetical protein
MDTPVNVVDDARSVQATETTAPTAAPPSTGASHVKHAAAKLRSIVSQIKEKGPFDAKSGNVQSPPATMVSDQGQDLVSPMQQACPLLLE